MTKMIRIDETVYIKLAKFKINLMDKYKCNYTMSEVIELLLLIQKDYSHKEGI